MSPLEQAQAQAQAQPPPEPTEEQAHALFERAKAQFPSRTLGHEQWYLVVLSALIYSQPTHAKTLYRYVLRTEPSLRDAEEDSREARQRLVRRMREVLIKSTPLLGICKPLEALLGIASVEAPDDEDHQQMTRHAWTNDAAHRARGNAWLDTIYRDDLPRIVAQMRAHTEFEMLTRDVTYGLFLSDMSVLDARETEMVTLAGIAVQDLPNQTAWHLRGCRRVGIAAADVEMLQRCVEMVAEFGGSRLWKIPRVADIEGQV
ncbi:hypothetical protein PVAG01_00300 [Phlyctema vagabunda]|uniref:Carboxymuconolactone decarboxylase-like domain-containing protein n=1 Tax=Phlyctema vagabunda TaxID=108571 RepID=A0ABR4PU63_9HELO